MQARVKLFSYASGHGTTLIDPPLEEAINQWLESEPGQLLHVSQSESERAGSGHHVTVCIWYVPEKAAGPSA